MKSRFSLAAAILACLALPAATQAQQAKTRITVMTFQSQGEKGAGAKAADELRKRLSDEFDSRDAYILPTKDVTNTLEQSGFSPTDPLAANDEKQLANLLRADEYVTGTITKTPTGQYTVTPKLVLSRDNTVWQALPPATAGKIGDAMKPVANEVKQAMSQLDNEASCVSKARGNDLAGALAAARAATKDYPNAEMSRLCEANIFYAQYAKATTHADSVRYADSALVVTQQIAQIDPASTAALRMQAELYKVRGDSAQSRAALINLIRADPTNDRLIAQVINDLAASGHAQDAVPLVKELLQRSPGDPQTMRTAFLVYLAANDFQDAVAQGPELIRADTAAADSTYFVRMAAAYVNLNQTPQALQMLQQGVQKYPSNGSLLLAYASALRKAGQGQQAADVLKRAVAANPNNPQALLLLADTYAQANQLDSVAAVLSRGAAMPGADKSTFAQYALGQGSNAFKAANASKKREDYQTAIRLLQTSDQISPSVDAKFLIGASAFSIAQSAAQDASSSKSCSLAQLAESSLSQAAAGLQAGTTDDKYKAPATQYLQYIPQLRAPISAEVKRFCK